MGYQRFGSGIAVRPEKGGEITGQIAGGRLMNGRTSLMAEIFVHCVDGRAERCFDPEAGINLMHPAD